MLEEDEIHRAAQDLDWAVAVFARNEESRVRECIKALERAGRGMPVSVSVFVNGSSDRTAQKAAAELRETGLPGNVYTIELGCKWNAMNAFIHDLRPKARMYGFVDATAFISPGSLAACADKFKQCPEVMVVGGVPKNGRNAQQLREVALKHGGFGQFFAARRELLDDLVLRGRRIPVGLYRGDGLLTGFIVHESNGKVHRKPKQCIACTPSVEYSIRPLSPFSWRDMKVYWNRLVRQARGRIENQAWNSIIWEHGFDALPRFGDELILTWLEVHSPASEGILGNLFCWLALRRVRTWKKPSERQLVAVPVFRNAPQA